MLDSTGQPADERVWPISAAGTPFTVWVPTGAPLRDGAVVSIQGKPIDDP